MQHTPFKTLFFIFALTSLLFVPVQTFAALGGDGGRGANGGGFGGSGGGATAGAGGDPGPGNTGMGGGGGGGFDGTTGGAGVFGDTASTSGGGGGGSVGSGGGGGSAGNFSTTGAGGGGYNGTGGAGGTGSNIQNFGGDGGADGSLGGSGGNGQTGGQIGTPAGAGGGGGGGIGAVLSSGGTSTNVGTTSGGNGGQGGFSTGLGGSGGGGAGGYGVYIKNDSTLMNTGTVKGGSGGAYGSSVNTAQRGQEGQGGAGVAGVDATVITSGLISGGLSGNTATRYSAVEFQGGTNTLELRNGYSFNGNIVAFSASDTFVLGGSGSSTFDVSKIGSTQQFRNFGIFEKQGSSTWTLSNTPNQATPWTLFDGTLSVAQDNSLGSPGNSPLTFDGGTLRNTASFSTTRTITINGGGGTFDTHSDLTVNSPITGTGSLTKKGAGTLALNASNTYSGNTFINQGTLSLNGSIQSHTFIRPRGTLAGTGLVTGNLSNQGTISPGNSIGTLTIHGNYVGHGGLLIIEAMLGGSNSPADQLIITGAASGRTYIQVVNLNGLGALTTGNGIRIIKTGFSTPNAFQLSSPVRAGAYQYELFLGNANNNNNGNWYLRSTRTRATTRVIPVIPFVLQEYAVGTIGTLHQREGAQEQARSCKDLKEKSFLSGFWARVIAVDGSIRNENINYSQEAYQIGGDLFRVFHPGGGRDFAGIYGVLGKLDEQSTAYPHMGRLDADANTVGAYWTHYGARDQYLDFVFQATRYRTTISTIENDYFRKNFSGYAVSLEGGYPFLFKLFTSLILEPQAQIIYQNIRMPQLRDETAIIDFDQNNSFRGRVGLRLAKEGILPIGKRPPATLALTGNIWNEFDTEARTIFQSPGGLNPVSFSQDLRGSFAEAVLEGTVRLFRCIDLYANVRYAYGMANNRRVTAGNVGLKANL